MHRGGRSFVLGLGLLVIASTSVLAGGYFDFRPSQTYASISVDETIYEFPVPIQSHFLGGDDLYVVFETHLPDGWFSQFCQESTGICYIGDAAINLPDDDPDVLRVDFFMPAGQAGMGWVNMRVYRLLDPLCWVEESFAVGHGVTLPDAGYSFSLENAFQQANPWDVVEFSAPLASQNSFADSLYCLIDRDVPDGWFSQYCQVSTGVCYFAEATIPIGAYEEDELRIDFFCNSDDPGVGLSRVKIQSQANPAIWRHLFFRVRSGEVPADVEDLIEAKPLTVLAAPNPLRGATDLQISLQRPSTLWLTVVDPSGRVVTSKRIGRMEGGQQSFRWDGIDDNGRALPKGVYFYRVETEDAAVRGKLTIER